jgi:hypothetical protein
MKHIIISLIFLILSTFGYSQITNYGPNLGIINKEAQIDGSVYQFGFSVRRFEKAGFIQPEVNLTFNSDSSRFQDVRVPVLFGVKILRTFRINIGPELRTPVNFTGNSRGLNQLSYVVSDDKTFVTAIGGIGVDIDKFCIDFRIIPDNNTFKSFRYGVSVYYLFGPRKSKKD